LKVSRVSQVIIKLIVQNNYKSFVLAQEPPSVSALAFLTGSVLCFIVFYSALLQTNVIRFKWHGRTPKHCWRNKVGRGNGYVY